MLLNVMLHGRMSPLLPVVHSPASPCPCRSAAEYRERIAAEIGFCIGAQVSWLAGWAVWHGMHSIPQRGSV